MTAPPAPTVPPPSPPTPPRSRPAALLLGRRDEPRWSRPALWAALLVAALLYLWGTSANDLNSFYSAAVYSGTRSWQAWFFGSLDAGNFLTVDKPPFALMVMGLSCRVLGFGTWQMLLPMVGAALGSIAVLHTAVKRAFGHGAAAVAAFVLALTPITVAITRDNNPDPLLVFLMVTGTALALRAIRTGRLLPLLGTALALGLAFHTKMLQAYIVVPAIAAVYLYATHLGLAKRIRNLLLAGVALVAASGWWALAVQLWPADSRPYIGGSTDGTAWDLILGYNGLGRVLGGEGNGGGGGGGGSFAGTAGWGRMFNETLGGQISWLLPFAGIALVAGLVLRGRAPRTDAVRASLLMWGGWTVLHQLVFSLSEGTVHPYYTTALAPGIAALCGGGGALLFRAFRDRRRWIWVLPAALAVTAAWAVVLLRRAADWNAWLVPVVVVLTLAALVGLLVFRTPGGARAARRTKLLVVSLVVAVVAGLAGPAAYAVSVPTSSGGGGMGGVNPTAGPSTGGMGGPGGRGGPPSGMKGRLPGGAEGGMPGGTQGRMPGGSEDGAMTPPSGGQGPSRSDGKSLEQGGTSGHSARRGGMRGGPGGMGGADREMLSYLERHRDGATWLAAVSNSQSAASMILSSKQPVLSMWGFTGSDRAMTVATLKSLVKAGKLHYVLVGGGTGGGPGGGNSLSTEVNAWVEKHGTAVKASAYGGKTSGSSESANSNSQTLYRLDAADVS
ncbi:ArnT family glycosyltransferase [Streptomyces olivaceiscleroticus]|uniref:Glycosyltransferase family 39 protein n=1 Tax=Streptomyces olivaceiscleroticus TaxID=68245 RepID=A0ABP3JRA9_9ACTN